MHGANVGRKGLASAYKGVKVRAERVMATRVKLEIQLRLCQCSMTFWLLPVLHKHCQDMQAGVKQSPFRVRTFG
jgi:hypothetical protein